MLLLLLACVQIKADTHTHTYMHNKHTIIHTCTHSQRAYTQTRYTQRECESCTIFALN